MKTVALCVILFYVGLFGLLVFKVLNDWRYARQYKNALRILQADAKGGRNGYKAKQG